MSLTSVLRQDRALAVRLAGLVEPARVPRPSELPLKAAPLTENYSLVGTAFDYLFRFEVERLNPKAMKRQWVAETAVNLLRPVEGEGELVIREWPGVADLNAVAAEASGILETARLARDHYVTLRDPDRSELEDLAGHALRLAKLDVIFRAGIIDPALGAVEPLDVRDLLNLRALVPFSTTMAPCLAEDVWLNPVFGRFSTGIQGADADVIASDLLVDIKTTKNPDLRPHLAQLLGYAMIAEAYRSEEAPGFPRIERVGAYFSRQGILVSFPLESVRSHPDYPPAFAGLMTYCNQRPLFMDEVRSQKRRPRSSPGEATTMSRTRSGRRARAPENRAKRPP